MVPEGGSAKLVCKSRGFPKPKITWKREDGREIIARNGPYGKTKCEFILLHFVSPQNMLPYFLGWREREHN